MKYRYGNEEQEYNSRSIAIFRYLSARDLAFPLNISQQVSILSANQSSLSTFPLPIPINDLWFSMERLKLSGDYYLKTQNGSSLLISGATKC
jgi:hypothetical protein